MYCFYLSDPLQREAEVMRRSNPEHVEYVTESRTVVRSDSDTVLERHTILELVYIYPLQVYIQVVLLD